MEINERRIPEIFLAIILVMVIVGIIFLLTGSANSSSDEKSSSTISDSYNTDSYNTYYITPNPSEKYYDSSEYYKKDTDYLRYQSRSENVKEERIFEGYLDKYIVYVSNEELRGGYFTVKFYFTDYYGDEITRSITNYIYPREEKRFLYRDINDEYRYHWDYEILSHTKN